MSSVVISDRSEDDTIIDVLPLERRTSALADDRTSFGALVDDIEGDRTVASYEEPALPSREDIVESLVTPQGFGHLAKGRLASWLAIPLDDAAAEIERAQQERTPGKVHPAWSRPMDEQLGMEAVGWKSEPMLDVQGSDPLVVPIAEFSPRVVAAPIASDQTAMVADLEALDPELLVPRVRGQSDPRLDNQPVLATSDNTITHPSLSAVEAYLPNQDLIPDTRPIVVAHPRAETVTPHSSTQPSASVPRPPGLLKRLFGRWF